MCFRNKEQWKDKYMGKYKLLPGQNYKNHCCGVKFYMKLKFIAIVMQKAGKELNCSSIWCY
jgi:hypothetical protein